MENTTQDRPAVNVGLLVIRIVLGIIFLAHGAQKMFGAFGGPGLEGTVQFLGPIGYLVAIGEFFGGLGILLGFLSRFSAASLVVIMIGAIQKVHLSGGFFLPKGYEFNFALIGMSLAILLMGSGSYAFSSLLPAKLQKYLA